MSVSKPTIRVRGLFYLGCLHRSGAGTLCLPAPPSQWWRSKEKLSTRFHSLSLALLLSLSHPLQDGCDPNSPSPLLFSQWQAFSWIKRGNHWFSRCLNLQLNPPDMSRMYWSVNRRQWPWPATRRGTFKWRQGGWGGGGYEKGLTGQRKDLAKMVESCFYDTLS